MKTFLISIFLVVFIYTGKAGNTNFQNQNKVHKVFTLEVIQVSTYTYLRVIEEGAEKWLAVKKFDAKVGTTYYYLNGMEMQKFESKELNRTFDKIIFMGSVSTDPSGIEPTTSNDNQHSTMNMDKKSKGNSDQKISVKITPAQGAITIAELLANPKKHEGKIVKITGQVTKFSPKIMSKNWVHLQDGTENNGKFDLTITTAVTDITVGSVITLEGFVTLNKDFGYGYKYDVMLENATVK